MGKLRLASKTSVIVPRFINVVGAGRRALCGQASRGIVNRYTPANRLSSQRVNSEIG